MPSFNPSAATPRYKPRAMGTSFRTRRGITKLQRRFRARRFKKAPRWSGTSRYSKRRQTFHNRVQRALNSIAETQFKSYATGVSPAANLSGAGIEDSLTPLQLAADSDKFQVSFNIGWSPLTRQATQLGGFGLGMFAIPPDVREGAYVSMIKNKTRLLISRDPIYNEAASDNLSAIERTTLLAQPINFRCMVVKPNMKYHVSATIPNNTLWMDAQGKDVGYDSTKFSSLTFNNLLMNKKNFTVLRDKRFRLNPPATVTDATLNNPSAQRGVFAAQSSTKYASQKQITFDVPVNRKIYYAEDGTLPLNLADNTYVIITATYPNSLKPVPANKWRVDFTTTTSYTDF